MANLLWQKARTITQSSIYALVMPRNECPAAFWRTLGYRGIGASACLGLASDTTHMDRAASALADYMLELTMQERDQGQSLDQNPYLRNAIIGLTDLACVESLVKFFNTPMPGPTMEVELCKKDTKGNNLLHLTAVELKPRTINWMLQSDSKLTIR
jgi:hypothetical protein